MSDSKTSIPVSRLIAASGTLLAGVYAAGFLVVTFRLGQFGVLDLNPFRPQMFLVGALFIILTAIPAVVVLKVMGLVPMERAEAPGMKPIQRKRLYRFTFGISLYMGAFGLASVAGPALLRASTSFAEDRWFVFVFVLMALTLATSIAERYYFDRFWYLFIPFLVVCQSLIFVMLLLRGEKSYFWLTNWFFVAGIATMWAHSTWEKLKSRAEVLWEYLPIYFIGVVSLYSTKVYPMMRIQFGGGEPSPVVLYLAEQIPFSNCARASVFLIDETDKGYYVLLKPDDKSGYFIRREAIRVVRFGVAPNALDPCAPNESLSPYP